MIIKIKNGIATLHYMVGKEIVVRTVPFEELGKALSEVKNDYLDS